MPLFPWAQYLGLALLGAFMVTMALDAEFWRVAPMVGVPWCLLVMAAYALWRRRNVGVTVTAT
jgi:L-asparagine transporter-like permease